MSIGARIVAVADVYEALTADRPYREAWTPERAMEVMRRSAGDHLASDVIDAMEMIDVPAGVASTAFV